MYRTNKLRVYSLHIVVCWLWDHACQSLQQKRIPFARTNSLSLMGANKQSSSLTWTFSKLKHMKCLNTKHSRRGHSTLNVNLLNKSKRNIAIIRWRELWTILSNLLLFTSPARSSPWNEISTTCFYDQPSRRPWSPTETPRVKQRKTRYTDAYEERLERLSVKIALSTTVHKVDFSRWEEHVSKLYRRCQKVAATVM